MRDEGPERLPATLGDLLETVSLIGSDVGPREMLRGLPALADEPGQARLLLRWQTLPPGDLDEEPVGELADLTGQDEPLSASMR